MIWMSSWAASKHGQEHWRSAHEVLDVLVWWLLSESQHRMYVHDATDTILPT